MSSTLTREPVLIPVTYSLLNVLLNFTVKMGISQKSVILALLILQVYGKEEVKEMYVKALGITETGFLGRN